ncbi:hypothetical protein CXF68_14865 [Tenacibaculum sp. Bg11-29]|uniref:NUMOD4 domain-containing protein n=1 Tax=Tenacibaculum sp. Bg11-29 TaxID=2058306 RepID=UPI000C32F717|nr:NUMOD4 domain-containing protein [Tenacibaculum sp. Bg11-29]PKH51888.1 hypothetical protein CXF68_14865 [Tenacibaculum sp. Bg11-29]
MAEEKKYTKIMNECTPILFNRKERWIQMLDLADGSYFVSNYGRIMRFNNQGIFHEIKQANFCNSYYVSIEFNGENRKVYARKRVGKLVLKYFVGGATGRRRYTHINGDLTDSSLLNLKWNKGNDFDFDLIHKKLKTQRHANFIVFNKYERWKRIQHLADKSYFISDLGRVMRFNNHGIFTRFTTKIIKGHLSVYFHKQSIRVGKLILKYFTGSKNIDHRIYIYLDKNPNNCTLNNIRWRKGFIDKVDVEYLTKLPVNRLCEENILVKNFLLTNDAKNIFTLLDKYKKLVTYLDYANKTFYLRYNDYMSFCLIIIERLQAGEYKPNIKEKEIISFEKFIQNSFLEISYHYLNTREFNLNEYAKEPAFLPDFVDANYNDVYF